MTPKWIRDLQPGDVVEHRVSGHQRIVRTVHHFMPCRSSVTFLIARPSWTGRCYTVYFTSDLVAYKRVPVRRKSLRSKFDRLVNQAITGNESRSTGYTFTAHDVIGIP